MEFVKSASKMAAAVLLRLWLNFTELACCFSDNRQDSGVVSRALHAILYSQLRQYRLRDAVKLVELVLRLHDVRKIASVYGNPDLSQMTAMQVSWGLWTFSTHSLDRLTE
jgi:hypothetical protein